MSPVHILTLSLGSAMVKALLLIVQPNIVLVSVGVPSARSFLSAREGSRTVDSVGSGGRNTA